jgi:FlaA1/EpsC-like NDP-sugar epimerase
VYPSKSNRPCGNNVNNMLRLGGLPRPVKTVILLSVDSVLAVGAYWIATIARFGRVPTLTTEQIVLGTALAAVLMPAIALALGFYRTVTRFHAPNLVSRAGLVSGLCGASLAAIADFGGATTLQGLGFGFVFALVFFALLLLSRAMARWVLRQPGAIGTPVAIYGAGEAGRQLAAMLSRAAAQHPVIFIDDDPELRGRSIEGLRVLDPKDWRFRERLDARGVREILIAVPSLRPGRRRELLEFLSGFSYRVRSVPRLSDIAEGASRGIDDLQDISAEELLGRDPVQPLPGLLEACVHGRTVLVTGGGGSIGSELCRQALALGPRKLVVLDHAEYALYAMEQELRAAALRTKAAVSLEFVLGSVTDSQRLAQLFGEHAFDTVYHAAAYKHVPIVELNPVEGFRNNALGAWHVARAAASAGVRHFVLISTDKAVRPTNVMGASKRVAELALEAVARRHPDTHFAMVRFGNVLASSGSVVPLFTRQIAEGGPVTLTHPDVTRYFMTIREAVELVIQAGAMAKGCELFVLDMGAPVRIRDLAERLVRLSGRSVRDEANPHGDIAIEITGLRPGEKLQEELLIDGDVAGTMHPRIMQMKEKLVDPVPLEAELAKLEGEGHDAAAHDRIRALLARWVSGYADSRARGARAPLRAVKSGPE